MPTASLFHYPSENSPVIYHQGKVIRLGELLQIVEQLAQKIDEQQIKKPKYFLNLYNDRFYFLLGFLLGLKKNCISLFPSTITPHVLEQLHDNYDDILLLGEADDTVSDYKHCDLASILSSISNSVANNKNPSYNHAWLDIKLQRIVAIIFTSGSTGQPRPYIKQWGDLIAVAKYLSAHFLDSASLKDPNILSAILATVPAQHLYGLETSIMMALQNGVMIHSDKPFFPQDIHQCLEDLLEVAQQDQKSLESTLVTTPLHLKACLKTNVELPSIRQFVSATAPLDITQAQTCEIQYQAKVMEIFGCTEVGSLAWRETTQTQQWTVLEDIRLNSVNSESQRDTRDLQDDVLIETTRSITQFLFNDVVELIDEHHFLLKGRKEDMINQGGKRASLAALNEHLQSCSYIKDASYYSDIDHSNSNEQQRLIAFVVPDSRWEEALSGSEKSKELERHIKTFLKTRIDPVFIPKKIFYVNALPRNDTGKLPVQALKNLLGQFE